MSEDKKHAEERRYAVLSRESIRMFAEAGGHADLPDEVAALLAEDVTYRLREVAQVKLIVRYYDRLLLWYDYWYLPRP